MESIDSPCMSDNSTNCSSESIISLKEATLGVAAIVHPAVLKVKQEIAPMSPEYLVKDSWQPQSGCIKDLKHESTYLPTQRGSDHQTCIKREVTLKMGTSSLFARRKSFLERH